MIEVAAKVGAELMVMLKLEPVDACASQPGHHCLQVGVMKPANVQAACQS